VVELSARDLDAAEVMQLLSGRALLGGPLGEDAGAEAPVYPSAQATALLLSMGVLREEGGNLRPTVAGLLAVGRSPQAALPEATVQCARFRGVGADEFLDRVEISGNLPQQLRQAQVFVRRNTALAARIGGLEREDVPEYPTIAVREAIVNALLHRDYSRTAKTNINIFDNRLEIISPGGLLPTLSIDDLDGTHEPRNRALGALLLWLRVAESWGTGIRRMREAMKAAGLPEPVLQNSEGWFRVTLYGRGVASQPGAAVFPIADGDDLEVIPAAWRELNERQIDLLRTLTQAGAGSITTREYTARYSISEPQALRDINQLMKMGLLERRGGSKRTFYVLRPQLADGGTLGRR
jgi:predicted HTH transcriptional regulator